MGAFRSSFRGPLIFAAVLIAAYSILVLRIDYIVTHSHSNELGMYWIIPACFAIPTSLLFNLYRIDSRHYVVFYLFLGLVNWGIIGFTVGMVSQSIWRWWRRRQLGHEKSAA